MLEKLVIVILISNKDIKLHDANISINKMIIFIIKQWGVVFHFFLYFPYYFLYLHCVKEHSK